MLHRLLPAAGVVTLLLAGCARFRPPAVAVAGVAVTDATDEALGLSIEMDLTNPNQVQVELDEFRYTVRVNGREVYSGRHAAGVTLGGAGSRTVSLPAVAPFARTGWPPDALPPAAAWSVSGDLRYVAPSRLAEILLDTGSRHPKVGFSDKGELRIR